MARKASKLTKAIRSLCQETDFKVTYSEARPILQKMGFKIAQEPSGKSDNYKIWESFKSGRYPKNQKDVYSWYKSIATKAGLPEGVVKNIIEEDAPHRNFNNERNYFDVTKWNYHRMIGSKSSEKPKTKPVRKSFDSHKEAMNALKWILEQGGILNVKCKKKLLEAELRRIEKMLHQASTLHKQIPDAA
jgi:hypothetical protein